MNLDLPKIWRQLAADKRKLGLMVALLSFALLLWGRLLMKDVPRTANAVPSPTTDAAAAANAATDPATDNSSADRPIVYIRLVDEVNRDVFRFDRRFYANADPEANSTTTAKLVPNQTDVSVQRHEAKAAIRTAAQTLVLNSTLLGPQPRAVINGVLLAPGETIQGFTLKEVRSRQVTVTRDGFEVVLEM